MAETMAETMSVVAASVVVMVFQGPQCHCQFREVLDLVVMQEQSKWKEVQLLLINHMS